MGPHDDVISRRGLTAAVEAARAAGDLLRRGFGAPLGPVETKAHRHDPVTVYDREADRVIADILLTSLPEAGLVSEERPPQAGAADLTWVVDPLDGTNNFLRSVPGFAVSIALVDSHGGLAACVYDPMSDELFAASRRGGTTLNGRAVRVSGLAQLDGAVLGVGFSNEPARRARILAQLPAFTPHARSLRIVGSAALDLAYVAAGRFDATWYLSLHDWDVAAGRLLVEEAGGRTTGLGGESLVTPATGILATNGLLHAALVDALRAAEAP